MKFKSRLGFVTSMVLYLINYPLAAMLESELDDAESVSICAQRISADREEEKKTEYSPFSPLQSYVCPQLLEQAIQRYYPVIFKDLEIVNPSIFLSQDKQHASFNDVTSGVFSNTDLAVSAYVQHMESFFRANVEKNPTYINRFLAEIQFQKEMGDTNFTWLWIMNMRFAASISNITPPEKDFYQNVTIRELFFRLLEHDAWKNYTSSIIAVNGGNAQKRKLTSQYNNSYLSRSSVNAMNKAVDEHLSMDVLYPVLGTGTFGICFLIKAYINNVFPLGIPLKRHTVHGVGLSSLGFFAHEIAHFELDPRRDNLRAHIIKRVENYSRQGFDITDILQVYPTVAVKKYQALMGCFKTIYQMLVTQFLPHIGVEKFRKAMVGFFQIIHEKPHFPSILYEMNDLDEILKLVTKELKVDGAEVDPFHTSPLSDGASPMSDKEIVNWVIQNKTVEGAQERWPAPPTLGVPTNLSSLGDDIKSSRVTRSNRFINVRLMLKEGDELTYAFPTLHYEWCNIDDGIRRLKFAGVPFEKPSLEGPIHARLVACTTVDNVENSLQECVNYFYNAAVFLSHLDPQGTGNSLNQRYWKWHFNQEQKLAKKFSTLNPKTNILGKLDTHVFHKEKR